LMATESYTKWFNGGCETIHELEPLCSCQNMEYPEIQFLIILLTGIAKCTPVVDNSISYSLVVGYPDIS
jgi:hypothetical protein